MVAKVRASGFTELAHRVNRWGVQSAVDEVVLEVAEEAAQEMRDTVESSATGKDWVQDSRGRTLSQVFNPQSTRYGSHGGRIDSGTMLDSIRVKDGDYTNTRVSYNVGWDESSPEYIQHQDYGFRHWITGKMIPGMNARAQAQDRAADKLYGRLTRAIIDMLEG